MFISEFAATSANTTIQIKQAEQKL